MPGTLRFLAPATHPENPKIHFGAGHEQDFQDEAEPWITALRLEGKVEILESSTEEPRPPEGGETPTITDVASIPGSTTTMITWTTDIAAASKVEWETSAVYDTNGGQYNPSMTNEDKTTEHIVTITGLTPETAYHYRVVSGEAVSPDNTFTTTPP